VLHVSALPDYDTVGMRLRFLTQHGMTVIGHAAGYTADGIALVEDDREDLSRLHGLQFQLGLDEIIWADDPPQVQLCVCLGRGGHGLALTVGVHLSAGPL